MKSEPQKSGYLISRYGQIMDQKPEKQNNFMLKLATVIVDKRSLIFLIVIIGIVFSAVAVNWVNVENDLTAYLPADSSTKIGLDVM